MRIPRASRAPRARLPARLPARLLAASLIPTAAAAAGPPARSGVYGNLTLVVAGSAVRGAFFDQRGIGYGGEPMFSCIFLVRGTLDGEGEGTGGLARIVTWAPGDGRVIRGEIRFRDDGAALTLMEEPGGCGMTSGDMVHQSYEAPRGPEGEGWRDVRLVGARRAVLRRVPGNAAAPPRAPFVVRFDPVVILERRGAWVRVNYLAGERVSAGWLREADLAPSEPPR